MWLRAKLNFSDIPLLKISSCLSDEDLYALVFFPCIWIAKVGVTGFVQYVQPRMVGQREKRQSKNKLSALCLKNNNKTKKTKARQKYGTHALTRFYEIQQKCELSCQFHIWFFFCHIYHKESEQKQSHYCSCTLWYFGTRPFCAYMPRCFYKTIKTAVLIRYLEEQKSWRLKYQWSSYDHKWVLHK